MKMDRHDAMQKLEKTCLKVLVVPPGFSENLKNSEIIKISRDLDSTECSAAAFSPQEAKRFDGLSSIVTS